VGAWFHCRAPHGSVFAPTTSARPALARPNQLQEGANGNVSAVPLMTWHEITVLSVRQRLPYDCEDLDDLLTEL
jgi:hypothetical protein